jgi:putative flippase GtrA
MNGNKTTTGIIRLTRYGVVGLVTNAVVYVIFVIMIWFGMKPLLASGLCYAIGLTLSYLINRRWTFDSTGNHSSDLPRFLAAYGLGLGVTLLSMTILLGFLIPQLAQLVTIVITAVAIYIFLHLFKFGNGDGKNAT